MATLQAGGSSPTEMTPERACGAGLATARRRTSPGIPESAGSNQNDRSDPRAVLGAGHAGFASSQTAQAMRRTQTQALDKTRGLKKAQTLGAKRPPEMRSVRAQSPSAEPKARRLAEAKAVAKAAGQKEARRMDQPCQITSSQTHHEAIQWADCRHPYRATRPGRPRQSPRRSWP